MLGRLEAKKDEWARLGTAERAELLRRTLKCVIEVGATPHFCSSPPLVPAPQRPACEPSLKQGQAVHLILQGNICQSDRMVGIFWS